MINEELPVMLQALQTMAWEKELRFKVQGDCMLPLLQPDASVFIKRARFYWPGDCLVCYDLSGRLTVHRLIGCYFRRGQIRYLTQGDQLPAPDASISRKYIIGKVCGGECDEGLVRVPPVYRLWALGRFCRFVFKRLRLDSR